MQGISQNRPVDPLLTGFGVEYIQSADAFVAEQVAPVVPVSGDTGTYYVWEALNNFDLVETQWSERTGARRVEIRATKDTFSCVKHGLETVVSDDDRRNSLQPATLDRRGINRITRSMMLKREVRTSALAATSPDVTLTTTKWGGGGGGTADPRGVADTAKQTILKATGVLPNNLLLATDSYFDLIKSTNANGAGLIIKNAIQYVMATTAGNLNAGLIAQFFDIEKVIVPMAVYQGLSAATGSVDSKEPLTIGTSVASGTYAWNNFGMFFYQDANPGTDAMTYMATFASVPFSADRYREERTESDILRVKQVLTEKVVCRTAAYTIASLTT